MVARRDESTLRRLLRRPMAWCGFSILALLFLVAFFAPQIVDATVKKPQLQQEVVASEKRAASGINTDDVRPLVLYSDGTNALGEPHAPGDGFLLGADTLGHDVWTRLLYGTSISLKVGVFAMLSSVFIGTVVGLVSGYFGGWIDGALMRFTDVVISLPTVLLVIAFVAVLPVEAIKLEVFRHTFEFDRNVFNMLLAIGLVTWTRIARTVRGEVLSLKRREFIEAAHATGCSHSRIIFRHLLPNVMPTIVVLATLATANNILLEAGLSYLGLGVEAKTPSWGGMISQGQAYLLSAPWIALAPGMAIVLAVAGFNLVGQALQETWEPRA